MNYYHTAVIAVPDTEKEVTDLLKEKKFEIIPYKVRMGKSEESVKFELIKELPEWTDPEQIEFKTNKLKKDCEKWTCFKNNNELNAKVQQRLREMEAADHLLTIKKLPQLKLHSLTWKRRFELAIDISGRTNPYRMVFETLNWENVCDDWLNDEKFKTVTQVRILEITDYH